MFYANVMQAHGSPFDVALDFGYRARGDEEVPAEVRVVMSWQHLKLVIHALQLQVAQYEEQVGSLPNLLREEVPNDDA